MRELRQRAAAHVWNALSQETREALLDQVHEVTLQKLASEGVVRDDQRTGMFQARYQQIADEQRARLVEDRLGYQVNQREAYLTANPEERDPPGPFSAWLAKRAPAAGLAPLADTPKAPPALRVLPRVEAEPASAATTAPTEDEGGGW